MTDFGRCPSNYDLSKHGLQETSNVYWNLNQTELIEQSLSRGESHLAANGALVAETGQYTGRSPLDRYVVRDEITESTVDWGKVNQPISVQHYDRLHQKLLSYLKGKDVFVQDCFGGADENYQLPIRAIHELAWHSLFARHLFVRARPNSTSEHTPEFTVLYAPGCTADPTTDGTRSEAFIVVNFSRRMVIIGGTRYAGEMKKSIFSVLNYLLPESGVLPMHCSSNSADDGQTALFFGLSGTGKTTLSADPKRRLIGDDEHGWSDSGVFNFEGGCYAKCIHLSQKNEPQIWDAIRFGAVVENVVTDDARHIMFDDGSITENTRAAYPVEFIDNAVIPGIGGHPSHVVFLTADAFGVLPPISRLTPEQAMYQFMSGYTAKVAGTERGLGNEPAATFSACFGAPFLPRNPTVYAKMLGDKLRLHKANCWLVNTGWVGGAYGVGSRMELPYTRAMLTAALNGDLNSVDFEPHPVFGIAVPKMCPDVPTEKLLARSLWKDHAAYDEAAVGLARRFQENFAQFSNVAAEIREAGPAV
jgi:phosphoenolpyruvate carboxykinase (ATP)